MGRKIKKSLNSTHLVSCSNFISFEDEVIQHLQLLKGAGGLVTGLNAVLRGLKKKFFCVVILISRKSTSAMYRALNMMCKETDVIFLLLQDISSIISNSKLTSSTAYGIKTSVLTEEKKFPKLLEKINIAKKTQKFQKQRKMESPCLPNGHDCQINNNSRCTNDNKYHNREIDNANKNNTCASEKYCSAKKVKSFIHSKHVGKAGQSSCGKPNMRFAQTAEDFLLLRKINFPDYETRANEFLLSIK